MARQAAASEVASKGRPSFTSAVAGIRPATEPVRFPPSNARSPRAESVNHFQCARTRKTKLALKVSRNFFARIKSLQNSSEEDCLNNSGRIDAVRRWHSQCAWTDRCDPPPTGSPSLQNKRVFASAIPQVTSESRLSVAISESDLDKSSESAKTERRGSPAN